MDLPGLPGSQAARLAGVPQGQASLHRGIQKGGKQGLGGEKSRTERPAGSACSDRWLSEHKEKSDLNCWPWPVLSFCTLALPFQPSVMC